MIVPSTPDEQRVAVIVGGHFTPDALGPEYDPIIAAVRADPEGHLHAFERLYLGPDSDTARFADLHLPNLLRLLVTVAPGPVHELAAKLATRFASVAQEQAAEYVSATEAGQAGDAARRRRRLNARHSELRA